MVPRTKTASVMDELRKDGMQAVVRILGSEQSSGELMKALEVPSNRAVVVQILRSEGRRLIEEHKKAGAQQADPSFNSPLKPVIDNSDSRDNLREILTSDGGRKTVKDLVKTTEGEFLVVGYMFNVPGGAFLVGRMLLSEGGRKTAAAIVVSSCEVELDPYFQDIFRKTKFPPFKVTDYTEAGREFEAQLKDFKSAGKLVKKLETGEGREELLGFFKDHEAEARHILRAAAQRPKGREALQRVMVSEGGQEFLEMLQNEDLGLKIGAEDLWLTKGGRLLVKNLLKDSTMTADPDAGRKAIFSLAVGLPSISGAIDILPIREALDE